VAESTLLGDWTEQYAGSPLDLSGYHLNFEDNFSTMSVGTANADPSTARWFSPVGANFGAATFVGPDAAVNPFTVADGALTLSMQQANGAWQSGEIQTINQAGQGFAQQYGYFEMSARFPAGAGSWPAFWLLSADSSKPRMEIDVVEAYGGNDLDGHHAAIHVTPVDGQGPATKVDNSEYTDVPGSMFDGQFHTYGALVTPDWIVIYYDHLEITRIPGNAYAGTPLYMVADLAMYGPEAGEASGKYDMTIDYIRAYADPRLTGLVLDGTDGADSLQGHQYADTLTGGAGADSMAGGGGDDVYYVDDAGDQVVEAPGGGTDVVHSSVSYSAAGQDVETIALTGAAAINATGDALANTLIGNGAANLVDGGAGADTLAGGAGNDTYYVDDAGDKVIESAGHGVDKVISSASFSASGQEIEYVTLTGAADIDAGGNDLKNVLTGNAGANVLDGKAGDDTMTGGAGNDTYYVTDGADKVVEAAGGGTDTIVSTWTLSLGNIANVENLTLAGSANLNGYGSNGDNLLTGNAGANVLDGGAGADTVDSGGGADTITGGAGADLFVLDSPIGAVDFFKDFSPADDTIRLDGTVYAALADGRLDPGAFAVASAALDAADRIIYNKANGELYYDPDGTGSAAQVKIAQLLGHLTLTSADFTVINGAAAQAPPTVQDPNQGTEFNDVLHGTAGAETMVGGAGDDIYYVDNPGDQVVEAAGGGGDLVYSSVSFSAAGQDIERVALTGSAAIDATGNGLANQLAGNGAANVLDGGAGADTLSGGGGDDTYYVDDAGDKVIEDGGGGRDTVISSVSFSASGQEIENVTLTGPADIDATGNDAGNILVGASGDNVLDGRAGNDTMTGGAGDDTYYVTDGADKVVEAAGGGSDTIVSTWTLSLGNISNVENLTLAGSANLNGYGSNGDNLLTGNAGANLLDGAGGADTLDGGAGADTLTGGAGADIFVLGSPSGPVDFLGDFNPADDTLRLDGSAFAGLVDGELDPDAFAVASAALDASDRIIYNKANGELYYDADGAGGAAQVRIAQLLGHLTLTSADFTVVNGAAQTGDEPIADAPLEAAIQGTQFNDVLLGAAGADTMVGGAGDDTYYVDDAGDRVIEAAGGGADLVYSYVSFSAAGQDIERVALSGPAAIDAAGNGLANQLIGNGAANVLDGGAGADTLLGGAGNDTYYVDNPGDRVIESGGAGTDTVISSVSFSASGQEIETVTLTGAADIDATGNDARNVLTGNSGDNVLDGRAGDDIMTGGAGDDTYFVTDGADKVIEAYGEGTDTIVSTWTLSLGNVDNVENLTLAGSADLNGYGSNADNLLTGNAGANVLDAAGGNDTISGGAGADTITGGAGADLFVLDGPTGAVDFIRDFNPGDDTFQLDHSAFTALAAGALTAGAFATGPAAADADDRIIYDAANGELYYDADGAGGAAQVKFAQLLGHLTLTHADFVVV
jgi:Ca2+-binding RTX toxin-like protein/beta-glucanase (GH16 family)